MVEIVTIFKLQQYRSEALLLSWSLILKFRMVADLPVNCFKL